MSCIKKSKKRRNCYPKQFNKRTTQTGDSFPIYRYQKNGRFIRVFNHLLDNRWVVPYNPYLLAKYDCHMNVEICSTIKAVKYLYKYIYKGHDRVTFSLVRDGSNTIDEIETYQSARWVSPPEAIWRIYKFDLTEIWPAVINLQLHLEDQKTITFASSVDLENVVNFQPLSKTMLTEFFHANKIDPEARKYLYRDFPKGFVWSRNEKM